MSNYITTPIQKSNFRFTTGNFGFYIIFTLIVFIFQIKGLLSEIPGFEAFNSDFAEFFRNLYDTTTSNNIAKVILFFVFLIILATLFMKLVQNFTKRMAKTKQITNLSLNEANSKNTSTTNFWSSVFFNILAKAGVFAVGLVYAFVWFMEIFPALKNMMYTPSSADIAYDQIIAALIFMPITLHIFAVIYRLLVTKFNA